LRFVAPGLDEYATERYALEIGAVLDRWSRELVLSKLGVSTLAEALHASVEGPALEQSQVTVLRSGGGIESVRRSFTTRPVTGRTRVLEGIGKWLEPLARIDTAAFEIVGIEEIASSPMTVKADIRYDIVSLRKDGKREERVGYWRTEWTNEAKDNWVVRRWGCDSESCSIAGSHAFIDVTGSALGGTPSYANQMLHGVDYWRTVLDGACGIDVYGNNGVAAGDFDGDGFDDLYVCQPAGLPNRLYRNRGDGTFEDVTDKAGVGVLDGTACALFADFDNRGRQDLLVVCGSGPLLFVNQGNGRFTLKPDAFHFERPPQGAFTHAAIADCDGDGRLDIYFCMYSYYLGLNQYHYPVPYFDARNGPGNVLMRNQGNGIFVDGTRAAGLDVHNDRYSFACAWGHATASGLPDLYVANDFGRANLYRNNGDGTFKSVSTEAHIEDPGAGMSAAWCDDSNLGHEDIYVANMWSSAGQRVSAQAPFQASAGEEVRGYFRQHARGNSLYRNQGDGTFKNISREAGVEMGRWSWCSDFFDFDHDGFGDLYVANGYISAPKPVEQGESKDGRNPERFDLGSFFWRQVVAKSPVDATPSLAYEHGWNALNELIRSDSSWSGYERNVMFANNRDGTFSEVSGAVGLDFPEDSRSFALADFDHDGRLEVVLKNRNAPQLRILHNGMRDLGRSISFRVRGTKSNRDGIGTAITVETGTKRQTRYLQSGSGFLAQHAKEVFFGLGQPEGAIRATVFWPSGLKQQFDRLPIDHRIELVEGSAEFASYPYGATSPSFAEAAPSVTEEQLPTQVETWLLQPLKAPDFSLPDLAGNATELRTSQGSFVLLHFWATTAPHCREQLRMFGRNRAKFSSSQVAILALNVDDVESRSKVTNFAAAEKFWFPVLLATDEVAGTYNIVYRYLFDRRRDLGLPTSFLLDKAGMIVKIYQGEVNPDRVVEDIRSMPTTEAERIRRALPLGGVLFNGIFQRNDFTYGVAMYQHGYLERATESFEQVVAAKPDDPEAYYNLGTLFLRKNDFVQARHYLEQTLKLRPNYPEAWNNLGMMAAQQGHPEEAIENFKQSLQLRPTYAVALLNLGNVYRRQRDFAKARESLDQAIALQPDDPEIHYSLGMLYAQQDQVQRAADALRKAIDLRPDYPEALNNLGVLFVRGQDYISAEEQFKTCIQVAPDFDQAYINLARLYSIRNDKDKAREVLQALLRKQPQNAAANRALEMLQ
jgi:Flp pilus assembly protein TadD/peroxiredoxin